MPMFHKGDALLRDEDMIHPDVKWPKGSGNKISGTNSLTIIFALVSILGWPDALAQGGVCGLGDEFSVKVIGWVAGDLLERVYLAWITHGLFLFKFSIRGIYIYLDQ